jgi:hypothetical protein
VNRHQRPRKQTPRPTHLEPRFRAVNLADGPLFPASVRRQDARTYAPVQTLAIAIAAWVVERAMLHLWISVYRRPGTRPAEPPW